MKSIDKFAIRGAQSSTTVLKDTALAAEIIKYAEPMRQLEQFCRPIPMTKLTGIFPKDPGSTNMAVRVSEGSSIPIQRTRRTTQAIQLHKNATHFFMTKEAESEEYSGELYTIEAQDSGEAMARRTDYDIANVLTAGAGITVAASVPGELNTYDLSVAKAKMRNKREVTPTHVLMNPLKWPDVEAEAIIQQLPYTVPTEKTKGIDTTPYGPVTTISNMIPILANKIPENSVFVGAFAKQPMWLPRKGSTETETYQEPGVGRGAVVTAFEEIIMVYGDYVVEVTGV